MEDSLTASGASTLYFSQDKAVFSPPSQLRTDTHGHVGRTSPCQSCPSRGQSLALGANGLQSGLPAGWNVPALPLSAEQGSASLISRTLLQPQTPLRHQLQTQDEFIYSLTPGQHIPDSGHAQITPYLLRSRNTNISLKCKISEHGNSSPCHMISTEIAGE